MDFPEQRSATVCRLCATPLPDRDARCPACGMHPARELPSGSKWRVAGGLLALYAIVAVLLVLTR